MINVRNSTSKDVSAIAGFQIQLAYETENVALDEKVVTKGIQALFSDPAKGMYYVAVDQGEIVGCFLVTYEWSDWRNAMVWWLQSVYVKKTHRGRGVFKEMHRYLVRVINNDPSIAGLRLYVDKNNQRAQAVYQALGMNGDHYTVYEWMKN